MREMLSPEPGAYTRHSLSDNYKKYPKQPLQLGQMLFLSSLYLETLAEVNKSMPLLAPETLRLRKEEWARITSGTQERRAPGPR